MAGDAVSTQGEYPDTAPPDATHIVRVPKELGPSAQRPTKHPPGPGAHPAPPSSWLSAHQPCVPARGCRDWRPSAGTCYSDDWPRFSGSSVDEPPWRIRPFARPTATPFDGGPRDNARTIPSERPPSCARAEPISSSHLPSRFLARRGRKALRLPSVREATRRRALVGRSRNGGPPVHDRESVERGMKATDPRYPVG
jgi:hypothetical protein